MSTNAKSDDRGLLEKFSSFLTVENIKYEIMKTAYGNPSSFLYGIDPRALIIWYIVFTIVPWLFYEMDILICLFIVTAILAYKSKVSILIIGLMAFSFVTSTLSTTIVVIFFGGNIESFLSLMTVTLKLLIISLSTVAVFTSIDPESLADALRWFGIPDKFCFGISYGYRILPILIDEYTGIFNSFRLRGSRPEARFLGLNIVVYYVKIVIMSFYPMILNTAKRIKITVESLETKGLSRGAKSRKVTELKFRNMSFTKKDFLKLLVITLGVVLAIVIGKII